MIRKVFDNLYTYAAPLALLLPIAACSVSTNEPAPPPPPSESVAPTESAATLTIHWSITEGTDPAECQKSVATTFEVTIETLDERPMGTFQQACESFATSLTLAPGTYKGFA